MIEKDKIKLNELKQIALNQIPAKEAMLTPNNGAKRTNILSFLDDLIVFGLNKKDFKYICNKLQYYVLDWEMERVIWIGYLKNVQNEKCLLSTMPKDIVRKVLSYFI